VPAPASPLLHGTDFATVSVVFLEVPILLTLAYASFALAQAVELSGIIAALTMGLVLNRYGHAVLSPAGRTAAPIISQALSSMAEFAIFFQASCYW
jgi:NhaP-type Na+/H+ or K+/H+ antiporter